MPDILFPHEGQGAEIREMLEGMLGIPKNAVSFEVRVAQREPVLVLADPAVMHGACQAAGIPITLAECTALLAAADISEEPPFDALARVGLKMIAEEGV